MASPRPSRSADNGAAMTAAEIKEGLARLGILHETTPPYTQAVNGKIETLWAPVKGRLIAMLEGVPDLTLAWAEQDYNRKLHSEIGVAPIARFLEGQRSVLKPLTGMSGISDGADHAIAIQKVTDPVF